VEVWEEELGCKRNFVVILWQLTAWHWRSNWRHWKKARSEQKLAQEEQGKVCISSSFILILFSVKTSHCIEMQI
jgi:hypothetical protein